MLEASALERRKTLVFSQFTSFLALVKEQLDERGIVYESLDGQTLDRAARVRRFNADDDCAVFLLSLKAGGVGLNLQSAERVILLDPWWNPAVEAQAIDRAHRIGQKRTVHAIRLISAGTIEDRVLELQRRKRFLADAIVNGDAGPIASMTREDLTFLLDAAPLHPDQSAAKEVTFSNAAGAG
ncbi:MAG: C-terminal helicase domain-containing protein [Phycisphaerae bacterium]|nr:C-terminal helicase domain-containing protein [Phycisphaerae bacterium]